MKIDASEPTVPISEFWSGLAVPGNVSWIAKPDYPDKRKLKALLGGLPTELQTKDCISCSANLKSLKCDYCGRVYSSIQK